MSVWQWKDVHPVRGNSRDKLRHTRSVAYLVALVLNKHQISGGGAYLDCYLVRPVIIVTVLESCVKYVNE